MRGGGGCSQQIEYAVTSRVRLQAPPPPFGVRKCSPRQQVGRRVIDLYSALNHLSRSPNLLGELSEGLRGAVRNGG